MQMLSRSCDVGQFEASWMHVLSPNATIFFNRKLISFKDKQVEYPHILLHQNHAVVILAESVALLKPERPCLKG